MAMGPVHTVLANSDLLSMIFSAKVDSDDERHELFQLALVCRKFSAMALDILWKIIESMEQMYHLFPGDIVDMDTRYPLVSVVSAGYPAL